MICQLIKTREVSQATVEEELELHVNKVSSDAATLLLLTEKKTVQHTTRMEDKKEGCRKHSRRKNKTDTAASINEKCLLFIQRT